MAGPELTVVCKSCGSEVSPYVTECPYCGTRLRKRAPKLERVGDEVRVREGRADKRRRKAAERRGRARRAGRRDRRTWRCARWRRSPCWRRRRSWSSSSAASNLSVFDLGAIVGPVGDEWWRYFAAPFVYDDIGYLFACGLAIAIFLPAVERRVGTIAAVLLVIGCGALGMLAADGLDSSFGDGIFVAAGGNGIALGVVCAWLVIRDAERRADPTEEYDRIAVAGRRRGAAAAARGRRLRHRLGRARRRPRRRRLRPRRRRWDDVEQVHAAHRRAARLHGRARRAPGRGPAPRRRRRPRRWARSR